LLFKIKMGSLNKHSPRHENSSPRAGVTINQKSSSAGFGWFHLLTTGPIARPPAL